MKDAKYLLIVGESRNYGWMREKEHVNESRNELMEQAMDQIAQLLPAEYAAQIQRLKQQTLGKREAKKSMPELCVTIPKGNSGTDYELLCSLCDKVYNMHIYSLYMYCTYIFLNLMNRILKFR